MNQRLIATKLAAAGSLLLATGVASANDERFSDFTPLAASAGPTTDESMPITLSNAAFRQRSIADPDWFGGTSSSNRRWNRFPGQL